MIFAINQPNEPSYSTFIITILLSVFSVVTFSEIKRPCHVLRKEERERERKRKAYFPKSPDAYSYN